MISWSVLWNGYVEQRSYKTLLPKSQDVLARASLISNLVICRISFTKKFTLSRKLFPPVRQLLCNFLCSRCAGQVSFGHRVLQIEDAEGVAGEGFVHGLQLRE